MISFEKHAFPAFDSALKELYGLLDDMASRIDGMLELMGSTLQSADAAQFQEAKATDRFINDDEAKIDLLVTRILTKFPTHGNELRFVIASINLAGILERIADRSKNCIKRLTKRNEPLEDVLRAPYQTMRSALKDMLSLAMQQVLAYDEARTQALLAKNDEVERAYKTVLAELHARGLPQESAGDQTQLLLIAKNLEQACDMTVDLMKACYFIHFSKKYEKHGE